MWSCVSTAPKRVEQTKSNSSADATTSSTLNYSTTRESKKREVLISGVYKQSCVLFDVRVNRRCRTFKRFLRVNGLLAIFKKIVSPIDDILRGSRISRKH
jgi:hypothetical protein